MRYKLLSENHPDRLSARVEEYLAQGWHLYGDPCSHASPGGSGYALVNYSQAVIKYDKLEASLGETEADEQQEENDGRYTTRWVEGTVSIAGLA